MSAEAAIDVLPLEIGSVIAGRYRVDRILGEGGMGVVMAVTHLDINEPYAIKVLRTDRAENPDLRVRFLREARAAVRIKSEHVARVADVSELPDGSPFILMEYLTGSDLAQLLVLRGPLPIETAIEYVLQACEGVAEAHALGFVHRDLKPSNLFLTKRSDGAPLVKVLDFGVAKAIDENPEESNLTETKALVGSTSYMSPEQTRSARIVDFRTDVWALGVILYELLTRRRPFAGETTLATLVSIAADPPASLREYRPEVSIELEAVVMKCLEKDVTTRYQSVAELVDALSGILERDVVSVGRIKRLERAPTGEPRSVDAVSTASSPSRFAKKQKSSRAVTIVAVLVAIASSSMLVYVLRKPKEETPVSTPTAAPEPSQSSVVVITSTLPPAASSPPSTTSAAPARKPNVKPTRTPAAKPSSVPAPTPPPRDPTSDSH